jgi:hypothetical protein
VELAKDGQSVLFSTYLGGTQSDFVNYALCRPDGRIYFTGATQSTDYPLKNAFDSTFNGVGDAFLTVINCHTQQLEYSGYLGGSNDDGGTGIALNPQNEIFVSGYTLSSNFPTKNAYDSTFGGTWDWFVTRFSPTGSSLVSSSYFGGAGRDVGSAVELDTDGRIYVNGTVASANCPFALPFDSTFNGSDDAYLIVLDSSGRSLQFGSYFGGSNGEGMFNLVTPSRKQVVTIGQTSSSTYPTTRAWDTTANGGYDITVARYDFRCCTGTAGNVNQSGIVDLADLSALVSYLTGGGFVLPCFESANVNSAGIVDLGDLSALVSYLTGGGFVLPTCL